MTATVGEQLKQARTERGLTIDQVTEAIHVRQAYIEALENDQRDALPSVVQGRGYLRLYSGFLNIPLEPLFAAWEGKLPPTLASDVIPIEPVSSQDPSSVSAIPPTARPTGQVSSANIRSLPSDDQQADSQTIFVEIGQKLRQQRESLGLSYVEVERYTRVRQHYLMALEGGRLDQLPSPVQGRGMLSNYAAFLNLNEDQILLRFAEGLQQRRIERIPPPEAQPVATKKRNTRQASPLRQFLTPDVLFGVIVVSAILFFTIRTAASISTLRDQASQPTARAIADVLLSTDSPTPTETLATGAVVVGAITITPHPIESTAAQPVTGTDTSTTRTPGTTVPTIATSGLNPFPGGGSATIQASIAPINGDPLQIYIVARQRAWLRITVDGKEQFSGRVVTGNAYAFSGAKRIELITGNAAALQIFYNQQDLGVQGTEGQVINLVFDAEGIQTPTPTATFTATPTPRVSATPTSSRTAPATQSVTPLIP